MIDLPKDIDGKKIGFTCSAFDILHPGYLLMLEDCKKHCDYLVVGLHNSPHIDRPLSKHKPVQSIVERYIQLRAVKYVDQIVIYNTEKDLNDLLLILPINIRFCGIEYKEKHLTGQEICVKRGIEILYREHCHCFSTDDYKNKLAITQFYNNNSNFVS